MVIRFRFTGQWTCRLFVSLSVISSQAGHGTQSICCTRELFIFWSGRASSSCSSTECVNQEALNLSGADSFYAAISPAVQHWIHWIVTKSGQWMKGTATSDTRLTVRPKVYLDPHPLIDLIVIGSVDQLPGIPLSYLCLPTINVSDLLGWKRSDVESSASCPSIS